jgi:hypothetical protein
MRTSDPIVADAVSGIPEGSDAQDATKRENGRMTKIFFMIVIPCK